MIQILGPRRMAPSKSSTLWNDSGSPNCQFCPQPTSEPTSTGRRTDASGNYMTVLQFHHGTVTRRMASRACHTSRETNCEITTRRNASGNWEHHRYDGAARPLWSPTSCTETQPRFAMTFELAGASISLYRYHRTDSGQNGV